KTYKLVLGTGTSPAVPLCCKDLKDKAVHSSRYLYKKEELSTKDSITIMGGGQSAAEIYYDLLQSLETGYQLNWITRSPRFFPLEYSKLTLEMTSPEYVDYFYGLSQNKRDRLLSDQKNLYKGINQDLINDIFDLLYTKRLSGHTNVQLRTNSELKQASFDQDTETFNLHIHQVEEGKHYRHATKALVLATGYGYNEPTFISGIDDRIARDDEGRFQVNRNYSIDKGENEFFVQNAELHTHGFVTPDLGMGCYRNAHIIKSITGVAHYPIETRIAFQQFEVTNDEEIFVEEPLAMDV
ncbi:MAG: SidA/IucD/PvdA family monooxygenase, partial [Bacteroidota bacterium]